MGVVAKEEAVVTDDVAAAMRSLQERILNSSCRDTRVTNRRERALDALARVPGKRGLPRHLTRSALSNARKVEQRRAELAEGGVTPWAATLVGSTENVVELLDFLLNSPRLRGRDRWLLLRLVEGADSNDIAIMTGTPVDRTRVEISRARARARAEWGCSP